MVNGGWSGGVMGTNVPAVLGRAKGRHILGPTARPSAASAAAQSPHPRAGRGILARRTGE